MQIWALLWHVRLLTDQPIALGGIGLARILPVIGFSLIGGAVADSADRRKILFFTQSVMALVALCFIVLGWVFAALVAFAGRNLARRTRYNYCLVMAGIECIFMPVGTVLGVFTIIVLVRDSVKEMFKNV